MVPRLGTLFGEPISAYFTMLCVGYALAIALVVRWAQREGHAVQSVIDCGLASVVGGIVGGRLLHVLVDGYFWDYVHLCTDPSQVSLLVSREVCADGLGSWALGVCHPHTRDCLAWAKFYNGGLVFYGGLALSAAAVLWLAKRDGLPRRALSDASALAMLFGLVCGRVGCFLAGCCYGAPTDWPVGVSFPGGSPASEGQFRAGLLAHPSQASLPVHPTQLYEALGCLALGVALVRWPKRFDGEQALRALSGYASLRFVLEYVRADDRGHWLALSTAQWFGLVILIASAWCWRTWSRPVIRA
ncbi:MAG TPA: prolipoprotein diacylglyceryl transferase family protein [Polyangiales bacterium]